MRPVLLHVAEVEPVPETGMGRVASHWIRALELHGFDVVHLGPAAAGRLRHPAAFPLGARSAMRRLGIRPDVLLVHEPASSRFAGLGVPLITFSHGLERRGWTVELELARRGFRPPLGLRSRLTFPMWRIRPSERGLRAADGVLLISQEDARYAAERYGLREPFVFRNGVDTLPVAARAEAGASTVLFLGSWVPRKGVGVLATAARELGRRGTAVNWLLAGTGLTAAEVLRDWPSELRAATEVVPRFSRREEAALFGRADVFVLPSFFEGQPLALLQAMAAGNACLSTNCCGQRDVIVSGRSGLLHEPGDTRTLVEHLEAVVTNAPLRARLGADAREAVRDREWPVVSKEVAEYVTRHLRMARASRTASTSPY